MYENSNGAGGHSVSYIRFRNVSASTCLLAGYPVVTATDPGRPDVKGTDGSFFPSGHPANMAPGTDSTLLGLEADSQCAARPGGAGGGALYRNFTITMPGGGTVTVTLTALGKGLDLTCGLHLTGFFDPTYPQPQLVYPLAGLAASLVLPPTAHAGQTLDYEVDLRNTTSHAIRLQPCPAYVEEALTPPTTVKRSYTLNCAPVAIVAAGQIARFEMRLPIPIDTPAGQLRIRWDLVTPDVTVTGNVLITH